MATTDCAPAALSKRFGDLAKRELHAHFNGCVPPHEIVRLLRTHSIDLPSGFTLPDDLWITEPVRSLAEYFRPWHALKLLPVGRRCFEEMLLAAATSLKHDNVNYVELRNSPFNIAERNGIGLDELIEWLATGAEVATGRTGVDVRWIISLSRFRFDLDRAAALLAAIGRADHGGRIVGLDLSGDEDAPIDGDVSRLFREAKDRHGLGVTIHAGERGSTGNIEWAIRECDADRIGHGLAAKEDPALMAELRERDICVEVCLTSNLRTGSVRSLEAHPVRKFAAEGVPFVLCSDNPEIHRSSLGMDYELLADLLGEGSALDEMYDRQLRYSLPKRAQG